MITLTYHLSKHFEELQLQYELEYLMREMTTHVQMVDVNERLQAMERENDLSKSLCLRLSEELDQLELEHNLSLETIETFRRNAVEVRESFVSGIGILLKDSSNVNALRNKVAALEKELLICRDNENDVYIEIEQLKQTTHKSNHQPHTPRLDGKKKPSTKSKNKQVGQMQLVVSDVDDESLLEIFSYLTTVDVIHFSLACRATFGRVDSMFGMNSTIVRDGWDIYSATTTDDTNGFNDKSYVDGDIIDRGMSGATSPSPFCGHESLITKRSNGSSSGDCSNNSAVSYSSSSGVSAVVAGNGISRAMADALAKKLNSSELKAIIGLSDRLRKEIALNLDGKAEREDIAARLQSTESVRNFLAEKLKSVELVVKASKTEVFHLKTQIAGDQEVISFLDLKMQGLETTNRELTLHNQRLQAAYDLQIGAHSHLEAELQAQMTGLTLKMEGAAEYAKAEKTVLVRGVRSLRAALSTAMQERDKYLSQLIRVRDAFNESCSGNSSNG